VEEDRPRARRGRVVPIQFVGPHQCREEQCSVTHCGRPRATSPAPTRQHKTTYRKQFRTPSTVHQAGATAHHRQNDGTMELSSALLCPALPCSALLCPALPCSGAPPALCIRIAQNSSQLQNSKTSFSSIALSCVSSHAPRPMLVEQGAPLVAHAGLLRMTLRRCRMARQPLKVQRIEPLASCLALRRARERTLRAHGIITSPGRLPVRTFH
jgi:hypothetical protein